MNKYPKPKKCPNCGKRMRDGETCYATKCSNAETNTEKKPFKSSYGEVR